MCGLLVGPWRGVCDVQTAVPASHRCKGWRAFPAAARRWLLALNFVVDIECRHGHTSIPVNAVPSSNACVGMLSGPAP